MFFSIMPPLVSSWYFAGILCSTFLSRPFVGSDDSCDLVTGISIKVILPNTVQ